MPRRISTGVTGRSILGNYFSTENVFGTLPADENIEFAPNGAGETVVNSNLRIQGGSSLVFNDNSEDNSVFIQTPEITSDYTLTLPVDIGSAGDVLTVDGSGNLSFTDLTIEVTDQSADTDTYFPLLTTANSNTISSVNVSSSKINFRPSSGQLSLLGNTSSSSTSTGTLVVNGGVGIGGEINVAGITTLSSTTKIQEIIEKVSVVSAASSGTIQFDVQTQPVLYYTSSANGNWTLNVRGDSSTTLDSMLEVGQSITIAFFNTNGGTGYRQTGFTIDGSSTSIRWQGGSAPDSGNANSVDVYLISIIKVGSSNFNVFASQTDFA